MHHLLRQLSPVDRVVLLTFASAFVCLTINQAKQRYDQYVSTHPSAHKLIQMSNGANDQAALRALAMLDKSSAADLEARDYFYRAELRDLNTHEGQRPSHTRTDEHRILQDYASALQRPGTEKWMQDRVQDYIDRRRYQYEILNLIPPHQYNDLEDILYRTKTDNRVKEQEIANNTDKAHRIEKKIEWTDNNIQNVHDSGVQNSLKELIQQVQQKDTEIVLPLGAPNVNDDIATYIMNGDFSDETKSKALIACHRSMQSTASHPSLSQLSEKDILSMVWRRSYHALNSEKNAEDIRDMVVHNLADTISTIDPDNAARVEQVCVTGRIGRIMDSLTLTDADSIDLKRPLSVEAMRNDIFEFTHKTLQEHIDHHQHNALDESMQKVAQSYSDPHIEVNAYEESLFTQPIVTEAKEYLEKTYGSTLSEQHKIDIMQAVKDSL